MINKLNFLNRKKNNMSIFKLISRMFVKNKTKKRKRRRKKTRKKRGGGRRKKSLKRLCRKKTKNMF